MPGHLNLAEPVNSILKKSAAPRAIIGLTSAMSAHALTVAPFVTAAVTYTESDLDNSNSVYGGGLDGYEAGLGFNLGARINKSHAVSLSAGLPEWNDTPSVKPGFVRADVEAQQIPVLLKWVNLQFGQRAILRSGVATGLFPESS